MSAKTAAVLRRAAELISTPEWWCQNCTHEVDENGNVIRRCLMGACLSAIVDLSRENPGDIRRALWRQLSCDPEIWNDHPGRTHAEVLAALNAAAEAEDMRP